MALDEISQELAPSHWLEERSADKKPAQQLGTLGGGNHFLEVLCLQHSCTSVSVFPVCVCVPVLLVATGAATRAPVI